MKTSLAPGSKVVTEYYSAAGLTPYLDQLGFNLVGYGCTTCIGNSGPLPAAISKTIEERDLVAVAVLSGNRNFEGRINSDVRANYLASPPLVVAYALAGRIDIDFQSEPLGTGKDGQPVYLRDLWPSRQEVEETILRAVRSEMFREQYGDVFAGDESWNGLDVPEGDTYAWDAGVDLRPPAPLLRRHAGRAGAGRGHPRRPRARPSSATASPPTTSRRPARSRPPAPPAST